MHFCRPACGHDDAFCFFLFFGCETIPVIWVQFSRLFLHSYLACLEGTLSYRGTGRPCGILCLCILREESIYIRISILIYDAMGWYMYGKLTKLTTMKFRACLSRESGRPDNSRIPWDPMMGSHWDPTHIKEESLYYISSPHAISATQPRKKE